jgi:phospholipase C
MPFAASPLSKIQHIVVLMLENRSFDNLLGWLYDPANDAPYNVVPPDFDGLYGKHLSNRAPDGRVIPAGKTDDPRCPQPNPGEPYEDVYSQVYDQPLLPIEQIPPDPPTPPTMQGFIRNYAEQKDKPADPATIMNSVTPKIVPVLSALAHNYALCDRWFASIPTQTFCNRSFVHAGTSSGYVNNGGGGPVFVNDTTTIYDLLEQAGKSWKVYCAAWLLESFTLLTQKHMWKYALTDHFAHLSDFLAAAATKGGLPGYSFIEPVYFDSVVWGPHNDMHPECNPWKFFGASNLHRGEALLYKIYEAIRKSPDWDSTLLIIIFDEHGGCYDHVSPPTSQDCSVAVLPDRVIPQGEKGYSGFKFDRLGPRVPAIVVSAYTPPQTRLHDVFEHTSVLSTVVNCFGLPKGRLGNRQAVARDLSGALTAANPRTDLPALQKPHFSVLEDAKSELHLLAHSRLLDAKQKPVSDLQKHALRAAACFTQDRDLHDKIEKLEHELAADLLLIEHEAKFIKQKASHLESWARGIFHPED